MGALFTSSIFPERAPEDCKLIRVLIGGDKHNWIIEKDDDELLKTALDSTTEVLGHDNNPIMTQYFKWDRAIPQYRPEHLKIVEKVEEICENIKDIYIGGNIFYGVGINDCTKTSLEIVDKILESL